MTTPGCEFVMPDSPDASPRRLSLLDWATIATEVAIAIADGLGPPVHRILLDRHPHAYDLGSTTNEEPLRLLLVSSNTGFWAQLSIGAADFATGTGVVGYWQASQVTRPVAGTLKATRTLMRPAGNEPAGSIAFLFLDCGRNLVANLPGYDETLPALTPDIIAVIDWWRRH